MKIKSFLTFLTCGIFAGCSSMSIDDFNNSTVKFVPQEYFNGKMIAYGLVKDRSGKITRTFKGDLYGSWDKNGVGTLKEYFVYSDGEKQTRIWTLTPTKDKDKFIGTAGDIVGEAPMQVRGNTLMIDYTMSIPYNNSTIDVDVKDWLHLQEDGVILNHSKIKKFGFEVGELVITIIKSPK